MAAKDVKKKVRPYRSTLRAQGAADTRRNILDTAMRLFLEQGYGKVTVNDIAGEASLAAATVYASAGGKAAILSTLIDEAMRDSIVEETLAAVRKSKSGEEVVRIAVHGTRIDNERYHDIVEVMKNAAAVDGAANDILQRSDTVYRQALGQIARRMRTLKVVKGGLTEARVIDILWFYLGREAWHLLAADRRWTFDESELWLTEQTVGALLEH